MSIAWSEAPERVLEIAKDVVRKYHPPLNLCNIAFIIRGGSAPVSNGKARLGNASRFPEKMHAIVDTYYHFLIWLSEDVLKYSDEALTAIIDHELCHCDFTDNKPRMRLHDIEEFNCIIERHGLYRYDLVFTMNSFKQLPIFNGEVSFSVEGKVSTISTDKLSESGVGNARN